MKEEVTPKRTRKNGSETIVYLKEKSELEMEQKKLELEQRKVQTDVEKKLKEDEIELRRLEQKTLRDQILAQQQQQPDMFHTFFSFYFVRCPTYERAQNTRLHR